MKYFFLMQHISSPLPRLALALVFALWFSWPLEILAQENQSDALNKPVLSVTAAVPRNWPPHYITDSNGNPDGFAIEAMAEIARIANVNVRYRAYSSFTKAMTALEEKQVDIVPNVGIADFRKKFALFTKPVETFLVSAFVRSGTLTKQQLSANWLEVLKGRTTAVVVNNVAQRVLLKTPEVPIVVYENIHEAIVELIAGRVDALAYPEAVVKRIARSIGLSDKIQIAGTPLREIKRGVGIRNDKAELHQRLSFAVDQFIETQKYQEIYKKWFGTPEPYWTVTKVVWVMGAFLALVVSSMLGWRYKTVVGLNYRLRKAHDELEGRVEERTKEVKLNEARFRAIAEASPNIIVITRISDGMIAYANPATYPISGYQPDDITGNVAPDFYVNPDDRAAYVDVLKKNGEARGFEVWLKKKDGTPFLTRANSRVVILDGESHIVGELEDITEQKRQQKNVTMLSHALEQSTNAVFITDLHGTIEYINPKFTDLTGYSPQEALGQNPRILKSGDTPRKLYSDLWKTIRRGDEWKGEIKDQRKDGSYFWAYETIAPVKDEIGNVTNYVATHEDISQRKEAELAVKSALKKTEIASRAKSDLMANMSHELRTPLNAIIGFSETMKEETFGPVGSDKNREYLDDINNSGQHLLDLINDILDASAIEADALELHEENININEIIDASTRLIMPRAEAGQVAVVSSGNLEIPLLYADERRVKQVLLNLLSNAVKFTPQGGEVSVSVQLNDNGSLAVSIVDTGIGMDEDEINLAMSTFGQVDSGLDRKHEGTGLGLPLTGGLVELHGGTLEIESTKGHGSSVTVTFPKERVLRES